MIVMPDQACRTMKGGIDMTYEGEEEGLNEL